MSRIRRMFEYGKSLSRLGKMSGKSENNGTMTVILVEPARESAFAEHVRSLEEILIRVITVVSLVFTMAEIIRTELLRFLAR